MRGETGEKTLFQSAEVPMSLFMQEQSRRERSDERYNDFMGRRSAKR